MKIVVIGGTGRIGAKLVATLRKDGHEAVPAALDTGVNTLTGDGLGDALRDAMVAVDVSNAPSYEDAAAYEFFDTSTRNLLQAEASAGVGHHVALSIVGTDRVPDSGYYRAKLHQEELTASSPLPYSIVHATQFFEFIEQIARASTDGETVRLPSVLTQPIAADDVADALARVSVAAPLNGVVEIAGPDQFRLDELVRLVLQSRRDSRQVITDSRARYFGAQLDERALVPTGDVLLGATRLDDWLHQPSLLAHR